MSVCNVSNVCDVSMYVCVFVCVCYVLMCLCYVWSVCMYGMYGMFVCNVM